MEPFAFLKKRTSIRGAAGRLPVGLARACVVRKLP